MTLRIKILLVIGLVSGLSGANCFAAIGKSFGNDTVLSLSGSDWMIHEDSASNGIATVSEKSGWIPSTVPGNIQADLEAAHLLKPLWYGAGDPRLPAVARKDWWYRKDFVVPERFNGRRLTLVFEGVDFECDVWLNGTHVGRNAGMFRRFWFDVAEYLQSGQTNTLAVKISKIPDSLASTIPGTDGPNSNGYLGDKNAAEGLNFLEGSHQTRQTLKDLKSPTNYGWDWGVNIWTLGIWKDVRLEASGPAWIDWTQVQTVLNADYTKARINIVLEVNSLTEQPVKAHFRISGNGQDANTTMDVALIKGDNIIKTDLPLDNPALWWCNGRGQQPLYTMAAQLQSADGSVIDSRTTRFGVRDVKWVHTEGAPTNFVSRFQLVLNGKPVRTMGSNLIPPDLLFGRSWPKGLQLLRRAKESGMTLVRMWGGGVIMTDEFYSLADELGLMLSVEMPLANCTPEKDDVFLGNLEKTTQNIIKQVRNHPAIIEYTGGNEMYWNSLSEHPAWDVLQKVVRENDDRLIRATCPDRGAKHSPWDFNIHTSYAHYNKVNTMRYGEFGTQSPANLEVWYRTIPPKSQWPIRGVDELVQIRKNIVQAVFTPEHWILKYRIDGLFGRSTNLPDLIRAGQFLGAEGLRYAIDANRRKGRTMGGFTTWDLNEPWQNGGGSYLVDYDGRALMNYDFVKQALAPVSLSIKCDTILYDPEVGVKFEVWLVSDALQTAKDLKWTLLARDRRGNVFAREQGSETIAPLEVKQVKDLLLTPPRATRRGPVFIEMQLTDAQGKLLVERIHVFSVEGRGSLDSLLGGQERDTDDTKAEPSPFGKPDGKANLAFVGNGAKPATSPTPAAAENNKQTPAKGINNGRYGGSNGWMAKVPRSSFEIDMGKVADIGCFRLGRDRMGQRADRGVDYLKIETSADGVQWATVFENNNLKSLPAYDPTDTMQISISTVKAQFVRATVDPKDVFIDEFEVFAPDVQKSPMPQISFDSETRIPNSPVRRTNLKVTALPMRVEGDQEVLDLVVKNTGRMTALFCEPHPLIEYRTDLFINNKNCFIPPGEKRTITIRSSVTPVGGLTLAQTGWRVSTWNADDQLVEPDEDVLLALGRRDSMTREYLGYTELTKAGHKDEVSLDGSRPDSSTLPLLQGKGVTCFKFTLDSKHAKRTAILRIHTADQSSENNAVIEVQLNGKIYEQPLAQGLGIQDTDPAHLAFPATAVFEIPEEGLKRGKNALEVRVKNDGWFTWDAMDIVGQ